MVVVLAYVVMVTASGAPFVLLQRQARQDWQARLYRFLPQQEYSKAVNGPTAWDVTTILAVPDGFAGDEIPKRDHGWFAVAKRFLSVSDSAACDDVDGVVGQC